MKTKHLSSSGLAGLLALVTQTAIAQTWQTVDSYQYVAGAINSGLTVAPSGVIFACGGGDDGINGSGINHGLVRASADSGATWSAPLDDFNNSDTNSSTYDSGGIVADSVGNLYVAGYYYFDWGDFHQFVRRSTDGGSTWQTVDDFAQSPSSYAWGVPTGITADILGNVYVAEQLWVSQGYYTIIRKGTGGTNFALVDSFRSTGVEKGAVYAHATAGIFAVGTAIVPVKNGTTQVWLVRRSMDGGATWTTVDSYQLSGGYAATASGVGADAHGNIYVAGEARVLNKKTTVSHWIVRKSANGGVTWSTVDDYAGGQAQGFVADSNGNLFVAGSTATGWTVRKNPGGTGTWQTVDSVPNANAFAITADRLGHVFVGGSAGNGWLVRRN